MIGKHQVMGESLLLDKWHSWGCCSRKGWSPNSIWIRVIGLPYFLWDKEFFENIGDYCGGHLETAEETINQSYLKWTKLRIKGDGREVPASVKIKVGNFIYDCPIHVDRRPWVTWFAKADCRSPWMGKKVAREDVVAFPMKEHAPGRPRGKEVKGSRFSKRGGNANLIDGKYRWVKVGEKAGEKVTQKMESHTATSINELPLFNRFNLIDPSYDLRDTETTNENVINADLEARDGQLSVDDITGKNKQVVIINEAGEGCAEVAGNTENNQKTLNFFGNYYKRSKQLVDHSPSSSQPRDVISEVNAAYSDVSATEILSEEEGFFPLNEGMLVPYKARFSESEEPLLCNPLAVIESEEEWSREEDILMLQSCGQDQRRISTWVINRMKSFKRLLGFSCEGYEDKLLELLQDIEEKRRTLYEDQKKHNRSSYKKGARELRNLECSISYDREGKDSARGKRKEGETLSICFQ